ncbi:hypothetical protein [Novosphingobium sp. TH158]|uniref:hypothetical protein n=1 Tax=Novosphingobium sp. TH158 TaxID=2067455 RepID=UPI000C7B4967|nr:hypothetical protein [Novosphingobium sp. TH158]PLK26489.1 hypothetical protein C0V78_06010 [Novosphingobium sp. TH158]
MSTPEEDALAKKRFLAMNLVRLSGVVMILLGLLCALDKIDIPGARIIGVIFILIGMIDTFLVPLMLAKRWRS